jgi:riboflavin synthase
VHVDLDMLRYIVPKGFVAVDGTSLTVCEVDSRPEESWFTFMLVEYTQKKIIIPKKSVGQLLNIEVDVLGKYSESTLATIQPRIEFLEQKVKDLEAELKSLKSNI